MNLLPHVKYRHRVLFFLCLLAVITYLDRIAISVAGPRIQEALQMTPERWGWVVGIFTISYGLFEIPTGRMGDRSGARKVLTRIVLWWSAFTSLTGLASNFYFLLLTRFAFGVGEAGAFPNIAVSLQRWIPSNERARATGFVLMSAQFGGALAPLLIVPIQLFSVSFGYFVTWFGSYDLALIPVAVMLTASALTWLKIDSTAHLFEEQLPEVVPDGALTATS